MQQSFVATGLGSGVAAANAVPQIPPATSGTRVGDLAILQVETEQGVAITIPAGWTQVTGSPFDTAASPATAGTRLTLAYKVLAHADIGATTGVTVTVGPATGDHKASVISVWRGVDPTDPIEAIAGAERRPATTTATYPTVTTLGTNRLIAGFGTHANDTGTALYGAPTNANLTSPVERADSGTTAGHGGGYHIWSGVKSTTGATGTTTCTVTSSIGMQVTVAFRPYAGNPTRLTDGTDDNWRAAAVNDHAGGFTYAALFRVMGNATVWNGLMGDHDSANQNQCTIEREPAAAGNRPWLQIPASTTGFSDSRPAAGFSLTTADDWVIFGVDKAGGAALPRFHKKPVAGSWTHDNGNNQLSDPATTSGGTFRLGQWEATDFGSFGYAIVAVFDYQLTDTQWESLTTDAQTWYDLGPVRLWIFNQDPVATVNDAMGNGNQTAVTGTEVYGAQPTGFDPTFTPGGGGLTHTIPDTLSVADAVTEKAVGKTIADTLSVADSVGKAISLVFNDSIGVADNLTPQSGRSQAIDDSLGVADAQVLATQKALQDTLAVADTASPAAAYSRTVPDTLSVSDALQKAVETTVADTAGVSDSVTPQSGKSVQIDDSIPVEDEKAYTDLPSGAVARYRLNETSGDALDDLGGFGDAILTDAMQGLASLVPSEPGDTRYGFDALTDHVRLPNGDLLGITGPWTIECTLVLHSSIIANRWAIGIGHSVAGSQALVGIANGASTGSEGQLRGFYRNSSGTAATSATSGIDHRDGQPHHVIFRHDGTNIVLTVDDVDYSAVARPSGTTTVSRTTIGALARDTTTLFWHGGIDDVIFYNRNLNTEERRERYALWQQRQALLIEQGTGILIPDTLAVADAITETAVSKGVSIDDALGVNDSVSALMGYARQFADTAGVNDSLAFAIGRAAQIADSLPVVDNLTPVAAWVRQVADSLAVADQVSPSGAGQITRVINDSLTVADAISTVAVHQRLIQDSLVVADSVVTQKAYVRQFADTLPVTDAVSAAVAFSALLDDTLTVTDEIETAFPHRLTIGDTLTVEDFLTFVSGTGGGAEIHLGERAAFDMGLGEGVAISLSLSDAGVFVVRIDHRASFNADLGSKVHPFISLDEQE